VDWLLWGAIWRVKGASRAKIDKVAVYPELNNLQKKKATMIIPADFDCQTCGACCSYSSSWPRFSTEPDADLDRLPARFVAVDQSGMRCHDNRCSALDGTVGSGTSCLVYEIRPQVCRDCLPGDAECLEARAAYGFG